MHAESSLDFMKPFLENAKKTVEDLIVRVDKSSRHVRFEVTAGHWNYWLLSKLLNDNFVWFSDFLVPFLCSYDLLSWLVKHNF